MKDIADWLHDLSLLFSSSPDPMAVVTADSLQFVSANPVLCDAAGLQEAEVKGAVFGHFAHEADRSTANKALARLTSDHRAARFSTRYGRHDRTLYLEWSATLLDNGHIFLVGHDVTEERVRQEELYRLAHYDSVTSLPNRHLFQDRVAQGLAQARRDHRVCAVLFMDLDNFKPVNDTHGHAVGDEVLRAVALRLLGSVRETDTVSRLGGDEFVIFLSMLKDEDALIPVTTRLKGILDRPIETSGGSLTVQASSGLAVFPRDGDSLEELLLSADAQMYQNKASKRS